MSRTPWPAIVLSSALVAGCNTLALGGADPAALHASTQVELCPLGVPGARVQAVETDEGVDVYFTAPPGRVDELRRRVHTQARVNGPERHRGEGHGGEHKGPRAHGLRLWAIGPVTTRVEETSSGAKLSVAPVDPAMRADVGARIAERVEKIASADCVR